MINREYTFDTRDPVVLATGIIKMFIDQLNDLRATTQKPQELEWEIRVYEFMLKDPASRLGAYQAARRPVNGKVPTKREAVKKLGWEIP